MLNLAQVEEAVGTGAAQTYKNLVKIAVYTDQAEIWHESIHHICQFRVEV